jgi:predicted HTH transcriptional regulator
MITLGNNQKKILKVLSENDKLTLDEVIQISGVTIDKVKNILSEYCQADIVKRIDDKFYTLRESPLKPRHSDEISLWTNVREIAAPSKLKNLARKV